MDAGLTPPFIIIEKEHQLSPMLSKPPPNRDEYNPLIYIEPGLTPPFFIIEIVSELAPFLANQAVVTGDWVGELSEPINSITIESFKGVAFSVHVGSTPRWPCLIRVNTWS